MKRLDSSVHLMVATEEQAEALESALKRGPLALLAPDDPEGLAHGLESFLVVVLPESEPEEHVNRALRMLG